MNPNQKEQWLDAEGNGTRAENRERRRAAGKKRQINVTSGRDQDFTHNWAQDFVGKLVVLRRPVGTRARDLFPKGQTMRVAGTTEGKFNLQMLYAAPGTKVIKGVRGVKRKWFYISRPEEA